MLKTNLTNATLLLIVILTLGLAVSGQTLAETVELTDSKPCGAPEFAKSVTLTGVVKKRWFHENETTVNGIVLATKDDTRYYINVDAEFIGDHYSGNTNDSISEIFKVGSRVKLTTDLCGKIYVARRVKVLKR